MDQQVSFQALCHLLEHLSKISKKDIKKQKLQVYIDMDRERTAFGMKESRLADFYIEILGLAKSSHDAVILRSWEQQSKNSRSDFAEAVFEVLQGRLTTKPETTVSIAKINQQLDELFLAADKKTVFAQLVYGLGPEEQKWLVRIILKSLKTGIGDAMVLKCVHPDAMEMYNMTMNLRRICTELTDPSKRMTLEPRLEVFSPFQPMLAARAALEDTFELCGASTEAIIEPKLDGERMQLHYDGSTFRYWSRRGTEYTYLYGRSKNESGSLTPYIADACFASSVQNIILDGEMLAYDPISKDFLPFGTLKEVADSTNGESGAKRIHDPRPCFVVFDTCYLNGETLLSKPLRERRKVLEESLLEVEGRFLVIRGTIAHGTADISQQMDMALANKLEGIIVKAPQSKYLVGRRPYDWIKLKPDYVDELCDDLDLLVVGASYGRGIGGMPGSLSSFTCAVKDGERFKSLCRVGSGISIGELDRLRARLGPHLTPFDSKRPPSWLDSVLGLPDKPDVVLSHPSLSIVIQVKATQIIESKQYPAGFTLRHPRYIREREDRSWDSAMSIGELSDFYHTEQGSLAKRKMMILPGTGGTAKRGRTAPRGKWAQTRLASEFVMLDASKVHKSGLDIFNGREMYVVAGEPAGGLDKPDLERKIVEAGGKITQAPVAGRTFCVVSGREDGLRLSNIRKQGNLDILRSSWLTDSIEAGQLLPMLSRYTIYLTPGSEQVVATLRDRYGDSYVEDIDEEQVEALLTKSPWPHEEVANTDLVSEINGRYLSDLV